MGSPKFKPGTRVKTFEGAIAEIRAVNWSTVSITYVLEGIYGNFTEDALTEVGQPIDEREALKIFNEEYWKNPSVMDRIQNPVEYPMRGLFRALRTRGVS